MDADDGTVSTDSVRGWVSDVARLDPVEDADRVAALRALEELKGAAAAAQARITVAFAASQRAAQVAAGVPARQVGAGIAAQVALARRDSPARGSRHLGLARALASLPCTAAAFAAGQVSEWRVTLVVRETACLGVQDRAIVDAELAALPGGLAALGDRGTESAARRIAYRLDPTGFTARSARAAAERRVSLRPAPDTMTFLTGLLPVAQGVAVHAALARAADSLRSRGDARGRAQIMADTLVERVTGHATAAVPVEVQLVMTDTTLLGEDPTPAHVHGYGPVPAPGPEPGWPTPPPPSGYGGSTPARPSRPWSRWSPAGARSPAGCAGSTSPGTRPAEPPGATPRSATWTIPPGTPTAASPRPATDRACASPATWPRKPPVGALKPVMTVRSRPAPPPATTTPARSHRTPSRTTLSPDHHQRAAEHPHTWRRASTRSCSPHDGASPRARRRPLGLPRPSR